MIRTLRQSFRRKKKPKSTESSQPIEWQQDETSVQSGNCKFHVKYLGCVEVQESRGMQVCEQAVKQLKMELRQARAPRFFRRGKKKKIKAILYVSPDALRVVEDSSKALLLDQTIEKVSFCAPDRNYERAFSYICRDGTTRRWICHSFFAIKESGERLSHAVGCAFAACLDKKQKRERETGVTARYEHNGTIFTREGSFRPKTLTEKNAEIAENNEKDIQTNADIHMNAVPRPHAPLHLIRQASLRNFSNKSQIMKSNESNELSSPFKRNLSLRVNELPSYKAQQIMNPVPEDETVVTSQNINDMCGQISSTFSTTTTNDDPFTKAPPINKPTMAVRPQNCNGIGNNMSAPQLLETDFFATKPVATSNPTTNFFPQNQPSAKVNSPVRETNPWAPETTKFPTQNAGDHINKHKRTPSQADQWLSSIENQVQPPWQNNNITNGQPTVQYVAQPTPYQVNNNLYNQNAFQIHM